MQDLIDSILAINTGGTPLNQWVFIQQDGIVFTSVSMFVKLEFGFPPWGEAPTGEEGGWTWIKFEVSTYVRVGTNPTARTDAGFGDALDSVFSVDLELITELQTALVLPADTTVAVTTQIEITVTITTDEGDAAGTCTSDGCDCADGFVQEADGSCTAPEPTLPEVEDVTGPPLNCYDGNNGGCSHYCNHRANRCECPTCWELQADLQTCLPKPEKIAVTCAHNGMTVDVEQCVYTDGLTDTVTIGFSNTFNPGCWGMEYNGTLSVTSPLDQCGFSSEAGDGVIVFSNTLAVINRSRSLGLIMSNEVEISVQCSYSTTVTDISNSITVTSPDVIPGTSGTGHFDFSAHYFTTNSFETLTDENDVMVVGETLNFGIQPTTLVSNIFFYVNYCDISDTHGNSFSIMQNMCPNSFVVQATSSFINYAMFTMNYKAFQFSGLNVKELSL